MHKKDLIKNSSNEHQRFSIRKLTIGTASVLLGSFFIWGANQTVEAAEENTSSTPKTEQSADVQNQEQTKQDNQKSENKEDTDKSTNTLEVKNNQQPISANELNEDKTERPGKLTNQRNDLHNMHFTGVVDSFKKTSPNSTNPNDKNFKNGDTAEITYKVQGWIDGNEHPTWQAKAWNMFYDTASDYLITIPKGFEAIKGTNGLYATGAAPNLGWKYGNFDEQDLGNVGKNGEQTFLIHTDGTPGWQHPITFKYNLKATGLDQSSSSTVSYSNADPLLVGINNGKDTFVGNNTVTLKNGQTYTVSDVINANTGQYQNISYRLTPGISKATPLSNTDFNFNALPDSNGHFVKRSDKTDTAPAEYILAGDLTFKPGTTIYDGNYIDFKLGAKDANNVVHPYYQNLDDSVQVLKDTNGNVYGKLTAVKENGEAFYRLVFNQNAQNLVPKTATDQSGNVTLHLIWSAKPNGDADSLGINFFTEALPTPYLYEQTNDPNQNNKFVYKTLNNDLRINGLTLNSQAPVLIQEKYTAAPVMDGNYGTQILPVTFEGRTWDELDQVHPVDGTRQNSQNVYIDTKETSDDFDIITKVAKTPLADIFGQNPNAPIHYMLHNAGNLKDQLIGHGYGASFANKVQNTLNNESDNSGLYFGLSAPIVQTPNVTSTVSDNLGVLDNSDPNNPKYVSTLHFKFQSKNGDPVAINKFMAFPVWVTFSNFTTPSGIHSYEDDLKHATSSGSFNHGGDNLESKSLGATTSNAQLQKALEETPMMEILIKNNKTGKIVVDYHQSFQIGINHHVFFFNLLAASPAKNETTKDVTESINYVYDDDYKTSVSAPIKTVTLFKKASGEWETDKAFERVEIPTPDDEYYIASAINENTHQDILKYDQATNKYYVDSVAIKSTNPVVITVHYSAKQYQPKLHFIDVSSSYEDPRGWKEVGSSTAEKGTYKDDINFDKADTELKKLFDKGYTPVFNNYRIIETGQNYNDIYTIVPTENLASVDSLKDQALAPKLGTNNKTKINSYAFGKYGKHANYYMLLQHAPDKDTKTVNETIKYIFQDENGNILSHKETTKTLTFNGSKLYGSDKDYTYQNEGQSFDKVDIVPEIGFKIISAVLNDAEGNPTKKSVLLTDGKTIEAFDNINHDSKNIGITVTLKKQPDLTDTKTVKEKIKYVFQDEKGNPITTITRHDDEQTLTFNGHKPYGSDKDYKYNEPQSFKEFNILPEDGFELISATRTDHNHHDDMLDNSKVKAIDGIYHGSKNVTIEVVFKKTPKKPGNGHQGTTPTVDSQVSTPKPTAPQPSKPQASKPQSSKPEKPETPKKPHVPSTKKNHNHKKTSKKHWNENYGVHGQNENARRRHWSNSFRPQAQNENVGPHAGIPANGQASATGKNSSNATLPETGEKQNNLGLIGLAFASIAGFFGIAIDRKRKN